jgi:hypothetical protein
MAAALHSYFSTACQHGRHGDCRLTCKWCDEPCRCACHEPDRDIGRNNIRGDVTPDPAGGLPGN